MTRSAAFSLIFVALFVGLVAYAAKLERDHQKAARAAGCPYTEDLSCDLWFDAEKQKGTP